MEIRKMHVAGGYQLNVTDNVYIYFDEVRDRGRNIMFVYEGKPSGGMWPPESIQFLEQWEAINSELP
jgi:hypothetical protein